MYTMILQHCQTAAREPKSKAPQTHKVPALTYIADPFFSLKERKLRTDEKHDSSPSKPISPLRANNTYKRPQSAKIYPKSNKSSSTQRTATDISALHRQSIYANPALPMGSPIHSRINQNEALQHEKKEKQRDIRQKIRNLFTQK